jgi:hypothetical protein
MLFGIAKKIGKKPMLSFSHRERKWGETLSKACYDLYIKTESM